MNKGSTYILCVFVSLIFSVSGLYSQSTQITIAPQSPRICIPGSVTLTATPPASIAGTQINGLQDDQYSGVINLGFSFTYFGNTYTQCLISSNNYITFNIGTPGGYSPWVISSPIPSPSDPLNSIMCPWEDLLPPSGGVITYRSAGIAPNRVFVAGYCSVAMFACTTLQFTSQVQLHETTNIIEMHIGLKPLCTTWNGGRAIEGIQNSTGTIAYFVPGRNCPTQWTAVNDAYRYTPTSPTTYNTGFIPYAPIILSGTMGPINWYIGATLVGTGPTLTVSPTTTTIYTATVTGGCVGTSSAVDTVFVSRLLFTSGTRSSRCSGLDGKAWVTITSGTAPYTYTWNTVPAQTTDTARNLATGTYCVRFRDSQGCRDSVCLTVTATPGVRASIPTRRNATCFGSCNGSATAVPIGGVAPYTYSWNTTPSQNTPTATGLCAGSWLVKISDTNGCFDTARVTITQPALLVVTAPLPRTICIGQSTSLLATATGGTTPYTYSWSSPVFVGNPSVVSPIVTTTYNVYVTDSNNCVSAPQPVIVTVNPPLAVTINFTKDSLCLGFSTTLTATGSGGNSQYTYSWQPGNLTGTTITVSPTVTTSYTVTVNDGCGTPVATVVKTIRVFPLPVPVFTANQTAGCPTLCVTLTNTTPISSTCNWTFGDGNTSSQFGSTNHCYPITGFYTVSLKIKDIHGCINTTTNTNMIQVYPEPEADFTIDPQPTTILNSLIHFTDKSSGAVSWLWNFGNVGDSSSTRQNPNLTYTDTGAYLVRQIVKNSNGCLDTAYHTVIITPDYAIYVPNAFTPNGDGINDFFLPQGTGITPSTYELYVFDRWGNAISHSTDLFKGWDGRVNGGGEISQVDTYVWKISFKDFQGNLHRYIGHVSLLK